jgi:hypothetical protein
MLSSVSKPPCVSVIIRMTLVRVRRFAGMKTPSEWSLGNRLV